MARARIPLLFAHSWLAPYERQRTDTPCPVCDSHSCAVTAAAD